MASAHRSLGLMLLLVAMLVCCQAQQQTSPANDKAVAAAADAKAAAAQCVDLLWPIHDSSPLRDLLINHALQQQGVEPVAVHTQGSVSTPKHSYHHEQGYGKRAPQDHSLHYDESYGPRHGQHPQDDKPYGQEERYGQQQNPAYPRHPPQSNGVVITEDTHMMIFGGDATIARYEGHFAAVGTDDGPYEDWTATGDVYLSIEAVDSRPLVTLEGDVESPTSLKIVGRLTDAIGTYLFGLNLVSAQGDVPETIKFSVAPKKCTYRNLNGDEFEGDLSNVTPIFGDVNWYELYDRSWFAGVTVKVVCQDLKPKIESSPGNAANPAPGLSPGAANPIGSVTEPQAAACVDMFWPNAPSKLRKSHIKRAMQPKAASAPAKLAEYNSGDDSYPQPLNEKMSGPEGDGQLTTRSYAALYTIYKGPPKDTDVLSPAASGAIWVTWFGSEYSNATDFIGAAGGVQITPFVPPSHKPFVQVDGPASYPKRVSVSGQLRVWRSKPSTELKQEPLAFSGYTSADRYGYAPAADNTKFDLSSSGSSQFAPECVYINSCGDALFGTLDDVPQLGSYTVAEIVAREWLPKPAVQAVCILNQGQEDILTGDCQPDPWVKG